MSLQPPVHNSSAHAHLLSTPTTVLNRCTPQRVSAAVDGEEEQERDMEGVGGGHSRVTESREEVASEKVRVKNNNEEERNLFYHHLPPISLLDKSVLLLAGIFLVPIRSSLNSSMQVLFQCCFQIFPCAVGDAVCLAREWPGLDVQGQRSF